MVNHIGGFGATATQANHGQTQLSALNARDIPRCFCEHGFCQFGLWQAVFGVFKQIAGTALGLHHLREVFCGLTVR